MVAARKRAPTAPQAEQRVQLLDELVRGGAPAHRTNVHGVARGRLGRDLQDREGDVQAASDVHVAVASLQLDVAGRTPALDQPVLQDQGAELGAGGHVVDDLGPLGPAGRRAEVGSRPRPNRY